MIETYRQMRQRTSRDYFKAAVKEARGNVELAAQRAGVHRGTVLHHLRKSEVTAIKHAAEKRRESGDWGSHGQHSDFRFSM